MAGLVGIIEAEGPLICHRVYRLYVKAAGGHRVGRRVRAGLDRGVRRALRLGLIEERNERATHDRLDRVLRKAGTPPVVMRARGGRSFDEIPADELRAAARELRRHEPSLGREALLHALADLYEIGRLSSGIRAALEKIVAAALAADDLPG